MDSSSRLKGYSYASAQQREMLTAGEQNNFGEGHVNDEHDAQTKCVILPRHRRHISPHLWWLDSSQHGKPKLVHDLIHHSSGTDVLYDAAGSPLWDSSWLEKLNNIYCPDQERISRKRQCLLVDRWPPLQPSPFIERAGAEDALGPQRENGDASGWLSYGSGKSTENEFEESETIAALEPPCRPLVKKMATPPQFPVSLPRTPSNSRPAKIPSTPHRNKEQSNLKGWGKCRRLGKRCYDQGDSDYLRFSPSLKPAEERAKRKAINWPWHYIGVLSQQKPFRDARSL